MALNRLTYRVNCRGGGFSGNGNLDDIPSESFIDPSKNFYLYSGGRQKRGGTTHVNGSALPASGTQLGLYDFHPDAVTRHTMLHTTEGKLYSDFVSGSPIWSAFSATEKTWMETYLGKLFVTDGNTKPKKWDGSAGSMVDFTAYAADWGAGNYPAQFLVHGVQSAQRLWGLVLGTNKYNLYASGLGTDDFSAGSVIKLAVDTRDGYGLIGGAEFGGRLMAFGKRKAYIINDTDPDIANWGYSDVQWEGGASHRFLIVKTQNDIVCMTDDGDIYSVSTVLDYGDYKAASLTRPSYMHIWIQQNLDLSRISQFHAVYNPYYRAIMFFVVRQGFTKVNTCLMYFLDRPITDAWAIMDNLNYDSGYGAACSALFKPSAGVIQVWTGGYNGYAWKLDQTSLSDNSNPYECKIATPPDAFSKADQVGGPRSTKHYTSGRLVVSPAGNATIGVTTVIDGVEQSVQQVLTTVPGATFGGANYGTGVYGTNNVVVDTSFDVGQVGKRIQYVISDNNVGEGFLLSEYMTDFRPMGVRP